MRSRWQRLGTRRCGTWTSVRPTRRESCTGRKPGATVGDATFRPAAREPSEALGCCRRGGGARVDSEGRAAGGGAGGGQLAAAAGGAGGGADRRVRGGRDADLAGAALCIARGGDAGGERGAAGIPGRVR